MATIHTVRDRARGCGWRKEGGLYMMSSGPARECGLLPLVLTVCPTCNGGIKPTRGWTWIDTGPLFEPLKPWCEDGGRCDDCPVAVPRRLTLGRAGLIWIGEKFYPRPADFQREARAQGVSRRIPHVPIDFEVGSTWVFLAHRKGHQVPGDKLPDEPDLFEPAIIYAFKPDRIEYVVKGTETEEELERMEARGITLVRVERVGEDRELFEDNAA